MNINEENINQATPKKKGSQPTWVSRERNKKRVVSLSNDITSIMVNIMSNIIVNIIMDGVHS
jgi:hypothetical protein